MPLKYLPSLGIEVDLLFLHARKRVSVFTHKRIDVIFSMYETPGEHVVFKHSVEVNNILRAIITTSIQSQIYKLLCFLLYFTLCSKDLLLNEVWT